jgi:hypothetical protein
MVHEKELGQERARTGTTLPSAGSTKLGKRQGHSEWRWWLADTEFMDHVRIAQYFSKRTNSGYVYFQSDISGTDTCDLTVMVILVPLRQMQIKW